MRQSSAAPEIQGLELCLVGYPTVTLGPTVTLLQPMALCTVNKYLLAGIFFFPSLLLARMGLVWLYRLQAREWWV